MTRTLTETLNDLSLKGEKFENTQHSNRQGDVYEIQRVYNGLSGIMVNVKYHDGVTETFNINQMKDDIHKPTQSAQETPIYDWSKDIDDPAEWFD